MKQGILEKNLLKAALKGDVDSVDEYADEGADIDTADAAERTALWHAASAGDLDMIQMLFKHGADPNAPDRDGITPLIAALKEYKWKAAEALLEMADINARAGSKMFTALHSAIWQDMADEGHSRVEFLMKHNADAYKGDDMGVTPLQTARDLAQKWPAAQKLVDLIEEFKDGPVAREQYLARKRDNAIRDGMMHGTTRPLTAKTARWKHTPGA